MQRQGMRPHLPRLHPVDTKIKSESSDRNRETHNAGKLIKSLKMEHQRQVVFSRVEMVKCWEQEW